jgi:LytS/YehU family sensor histidine kinase
MAITTVAAIAWLLLSRSIMLLLPSSFTESEGFWSQSVPVRMAIGFLMLGTNTLINVLWYTLQEQQEDEKRKSESAALTREAELYKLKEQLHPHFLFNSLNSINALIGMQPMQARTMIQQLADFLRGTLKKADNEWNELEEEIKHLQLYLDIEKVRFGHRLQTDIVMDAFAAQSRIPAMLLQPAVENAIKFGLYDTTEEILISIQAHLDNNVLQVSITNPYDAGISSRQKGTGFGLRSIERRLFLLFSQSGLLKTTSADGLFTTTIFIPQIA